MVHRVLFPPTILALTMALFSMPSVHAQTKFTPRQQQKLLSNAQAASKSIEGTWVLQQRFNPNGKPHKQPLKGEFTVKLPVDQSAIAKLSSVGVGTLAAGSYEGFETGLMDAGFSDFSPGEDVINPNPVGKAAASGDVLFEMRGNSKLAMEMNINSPNSLDLVFLNLELKGTYGVFRQGVRGARVPSKFQMSTSRLKGGGATLTLRNTIGASDLQIASGARGPGIASDKSHEIVKHVIKGNRMDIGYGNGGRDIWVRKQ